MKPAVLLLISEGLLIIAAVLLFSGLKGNVGMNFGWPVSQFAFTTAAEAHGAPVALAVFAVIGAAVTLVAGLLAMMKTSRMTA